MRISFKSVSASGVALAVCSGLAFSQSPATPAVAPLPAPPAPTTEAPLYDSQPFPAIRGEFDRLTLSGRGDVDGFILKDGTEVKTAPAISAQIPAILKPGDRVTVRGLKAAALPLVQAVSITDETSKRTLTDTGAPTPRSAPPPPPPLEGAPPADGVGPARSSVDSKEISGRVRMALHGRHGEVNGVLLDNGTILRFPPDRGSRVALLIQPHQPIVAEGTTLTNASGTVFEVQQLGPSRTQLILVEPPANPRAARGPAGPRPHPRGNAADGTSPSPPAPPADAAPPVPSPPPGAAPRPGT